MNLHFIKYSLGKLLQLLSFAMIIPAAIAIFETYPITDSLPELFLHINVSGLLLAIVLSFFIGSFLTLLPAKNMDDKTVREAFAIVTFGWIILTVFGCIPFVLFFMHTGNQTGIRVIFDCFTNSFFEIMSGFTTTGATILTDIEVLPKGLLFWRSMTHWLGGMGIVTLGLAVFPAFGVNAYQMFRGEVPGPTTERLKPSLTQTAKILWGVYAALTFAEALLLFAGGMTLFDAFCHAFGTMATGGFSTRNASIASYNSAYIDWVICLFMFMAGMNFIIHYQLIFFRKWEILKANHEFRFYANIIFLAIVVVTLMLLFSGLGDANDITRSFRNAPLSPERTTEKIAVEESKISSIGSCIRSAAFQVISLVTTTGFCTADFDIWPGLIRLLLVILMFFGGCAGSTGGGMKMIRIMVVLKTAWREVLTIIQPRQIIPVRIAEKAVDEKQIRSIVGFFMLFLICTVFFSLVMTLFIPDFTTAITAVVATICNIGPGLSGVGATENYAWIPSGGKWVLSFCMLLGRLELYTVLIAFAPVSWRK